MINLVFIVSLTKSALNIDMFDYITCDLLVSRPLKLLDHRRASLMIWRTLLVSIWIHENRVWLQN